MLVWQVLQKKRKENRSNKERGSMNIQHAHTNELVKRRLVFSSVMEKTRFKKNMKKVLVEVFFCVSALLLQQPSFSFTYMMIIIIKVQHLLVFLSCSPFMSAYLYKCFLNWYTCYNITLRNRTKQSLVWMIVCNIFAYHLNEFLMLLIHKGACVCKNALALQKFLLETNKKELIFMGNK